MNTRTLKFSDNGKFKILVASDLHEWTASDIDSRLDGKKTEDTMLLLDASIKALDPDLVVFNGDNAFGNTKEDLRKSVENITKTVKKYNKPLALVMGNCEHDPEANRFSPEEISEIFCEYDNCFFRNDDKNITGYGNYFIPITDSTGKVKFNLWFMDSNGISPDREVSFVYDWVHEDQIKWYRKKAEKLAKENGGKPVRSILFQHIPVQEEYRLLREAKPFEYSKAVKGFGNTGGKYYVPNEPISGEFNEPVACSDYNSGEFESWKETGDIVAAFFGHNHNNDFEGFVDGILLSQCRGSGFHGYHDGNKTGVKLITISEDTLTVDTKNFYFSDFCLKSKSNVKIEQKLTAKQKNKLVKAVSVGAGVAAVTAVAVVSKRSKKK